MRPPSTMMQLEASSSVWYPYAPYDALRLGTAARALKGSLLWLAAAFLFDWWTRPQIQISGNLRGLV